jgi:hypothetical protein
LQFISWKLKSFLFFHFSSILLQVFLTNQAKHHYFCDVFSGQLFFLMSLLFFYNFLQIYQFLNFNRSVFSVFIKTSRFVDRSREARTQARVLCRVRGPASRWRYVSSARVLLSELCVCADWSPATNPAADALALRAWGGQPATSHPSMAGAFTRPSSPHARSRIDSEASIMKPSSLTHN